MTVLPPADGKAPRSAKAYSSELFFSYIELSQWLGLVHEEYGVKTP